MTASPGAQILTARGRPRTAVVPGETRGWYTARRDIPDHGGKRRVLVHCSACDRDVVISIDTWVGMQRRRAEDAPAVCHHQGPRLDVVLAAVPTRGPTTAQRVRAVLEDLADAAEARPEALRAEVSALRARVRTLRDDGGGLVGARAADACARLLEYAAGAPDALRLVAREG